MRTARIGEVVRGVGALWLALLPQAGALLLAVAKLIDAFGPAGRWRLPLGLWAAWLPFLLPVPVQLAAASTFDGWLTAQVGLALLASLVVSSERAVPFRWVLAGLAAALALMVVERSVSTGLWGDETPALSWSGVRGVSTLSVDDRVKGSSSSRYVPKSWIGVDRDGLYLAELEVRASSSDFGWDWYRYADGFGVRRVPGDEAVASAVEVPPTGEPLRYVSREVNLGESIAGRRFRARLELRSETRQVTSGCRGVLLQENGRPYRGACLSVELGPEWRTFELEFSAPDDSTVTGVRVVLNDLERDFEVRGAVIEELVAGTWHTLPAPEPTGVGLMPAFAGRRRQEHFSVRLTPTESWQRLALAVPGSEADARGRLTLLLQVEGGTSIIVRDVSLAPLDGTSKRPIPSPSERLRLWYPHPNLAGHAFVSLAALALRVAQGATASAATLALAAPAVLFTGSRTALVGLTLVAFLSIAVGAVWRSDVARPRLGSLGILVAFAASALVLSLAGALPERLNPLAAEVGTVRRPEIWRAALEMMLESPLLGLSGDGRSFADAWRVAHEGSASEPPVHAHNLWLEFGVRYGVPGVVGAVLGTAALVAFAWRRSRWRGVAVLVPMLVMQVADATLFTAGVLFPLMLAISAELRSDSPRAGSPC